MPENIYILWDMSSEKKTEITDKILDAFLEGGLSSETNELIQGWIVNKEDFELKDEALRKRFFAKVQPDMKYGRKALESLDEIREALEFPKSGTVKTAGLRHKAVLKFAAAILPLLIIAGAAVFYFNKPADNISQEADIISQDTVITVTAAGERKELVLNDGTHIWLSENSRLEYLGDFINNRTVRLIGKAYFSVAKYEGSRFEVKADGFTVSVLGTEFLVRTNSGNGKTEVALSSGKVKVANDKNNIVYELSPQEQLLLDNITLEVIKNIVPDEYITAYKTTEPVVSSMLTLSGVFAKIADKYKVSFAVGSGVNIGETIRINVNNDLPLSELMEIIRSVSDSPFDFSIKADTVWVTKR